MNQFERVSAVAKKLEMSMRKVAVESGYAEGSNGPYKKQGRFGFRVLHQLEQFGIRKQYITDGIKPIFANNEGGKRLRTIYNLNVPAEEREIVEDMEAKVQISEHLNQITVQSGFNVVAHSPFPVNSGMKVPSFDFLRSVNMGGVATYYHILVSEAVNFMAFTVMSRELEFMKIFPSDLIIVRQEQEISVSMEGSLLVYATKENQLRCDLLRKIGNGLHLISMEFKNDDLIITSKNPITDIKLIGEVVWCEKSIQEFKFLAALPPEVAV